MRHPRISLASILCVLALSSCGGSSGPAEVSPAAYVKSICASLSTWKGAIQSASGQLQAGTRAAKSLAQGKQQYITFLEALVQATGTSATGLKAAGVPNVSGGKQISTMLAQAFTHAASSLSTAVSQAKNIPTTSSAAYQAAGAGVNATVRQSLSGLASISPRRNAQLKAAAAKEPACKVLTAVA